MTQAELPNNGSPSSLVPPQAAQRRWDDDRLFSSYGAFYQQVYGSVSAEIVSVGRCGAEILRADQGKGDWSDAPTPSLVIGMMLHGAPCGFSFDLGAGRFRGTMCAGQSILIAPHIGSSIQMEADHGLLAIGIPYAVARAFAGDEAGLPADGDFGALHTRVSDDREIARILERLWNARHQRNTLYADGLILQLLGILANGADRAISPGGGLASWQERRVIEHLRAHFADDVSLVELGDLAGLSTFHFARAFKRSTGLTPHGYLRMLRTDRARELLETGHMSIAEIANAVGYESSQALARAFRREIGASPSAYRRERGR